MGVESNLRIVSAIEYRKQIETFQYSTSHYALKLLSCKG